MPERIKVADQSIVATANSSEIKFDIYGPSINGARQPITNSVSVNIATLPPAMLNHCAAVGFGFIAANKYRRVDDADVAAIVAEVEAAMRDGTWTPGREAGPHEPTPFVEALAALTHVSTDVIEEDMKNKTKWTRAFTAQVRNDPRVAERVARIITERAKRDAEAGRARAKGQKPSLELGSLFGAPAAPQAA